MLLNSDLSTPGPLSSIDKIIVEFFVSKFTNIFSAYLTEFSSKLLMHLVTKFFLQLK